MEYVNKVVFVILFSLVVILLMIHVPARNYQKVINEKDKTIVRLQKENTTYRNACQDWSLITKDLRKQLADCQKEK